MRSEILSVVALWLAVALALLVLDAIVSGLLALVCRRNFRRCFRRGLLSQALPPLLLLYGMLIERNCYRVRNVELVSETLPAAFDGYTLVQLSDIHSSSFRFRIRSLERAMDKVNALGADLIVFTGDLVTLLPSELQKTAPALARLHAPDGVLSVLGNHDYCPYFPGAYRQANLDSLEAVAARERALGWDLLRNENRRIVRGGDTLAVVGVENISDIPKFPSTGDLPLAMQGTEGCWRILLSHDPTHWERDVVGKVDIPLTLSGHTHAAQVSLFGLWTPSSLKYRHTHGLYREQGQYLYVNIGLGETIFPARFCAVPEITRIVLRRKGE